MSKFIRFADYFKKMLEEDVTAGSAGVGGDGSGFSPDNSTSSDSYAPGDARTPSSLFGKGKVQTRIKKKKKKSKVRKEEDEEQDHPFECECGEKWQTKEGADSCKECNG